jgi:hypothetical protein
MSALGTPPGRIERALGRSHGGTGPLQRRRAWPGLTLNGWICSNEWSDLEPGHGAPRLMLGEVRSARMVYVVKATSTERGGGEILTADAKTRRHAVALAKDLRRQGMHVIITGPDGEPIDETEDE